MRNEEEETVDKVVVLSVGLVTYLAILSSCVCVDVGV